MLSTRLVRAALGATVLLGLAGGPHTAAAQSTPPSAPSGDSIQLIGLTTVPPLPTSPAETIRFEARLRYQLESVPSGFALLFAFEDDNRAATQQSQEGVPLPQGANDVTLDFDYFPTPDVQKLSLMVGLFADEQNLLGWVATSPFDLAPWRARTDFDRAIAAKNAGDWSTALDLITEAIQLAPDTANLYYWRGDIQVHQSAYDPAIADYSKALDLIPGNRPSLVGRGVANIWEQNWSLALDDLAQVVDSPAPPDQWTALAHRARGLAYAGLDRPDQAIAEYQAYLNLRPDADDRAQVEGWIADLQQ
jgi:tetratricopeptide (TPR) repeat protein